MNKTKITVKELPFTAFRGISSRQRSYIDEFTFYRLPNSHVEAWYAGDLLAVWDGKSWTNPCDPG